MSYSQSNNYKAMGSGLKTKTVLTQKDVFTASSAINAFNVRATNEQVGKIMNPSAMNAP